MKSWDFSDIACLQAEVTSFYFVKLSRGSMKFSFKELDQDLYLIEKQYTSKNRSHGSDITGPYWMLIEVKIVTGNIWWNSDGIRKNPTQRSLFIYLPPFTWAMEHCEENTTLKVRALLSRKEIYAPKFSGPILFYTKKSLPKTENKINSFLNNINEYEQIGTNTNPSHLSARTKKLIDENYQQSIEIQEIAKKLKSQSATLSRKFKLDFGESPVFYRKGLRSTVGMYELMMGTPPIQAAELAGYQDLSRFYKQFKSYLKQTPSEYSKKSKNA